MCGCMTAALFGWEIEPTADGWVGCDRRENIQVGPLPSRDEAIEALRLKVRRLAEARNKQRMQAMGLGG